MNNCLDLRKTYYKNYPLKKMSEQIQSTSDTCYQFYSKVKDISSDNIFQSNDFLFQEAVRDVVRELKIILYTAPISASDKLLWKLDVESKANPNWYEKYDNYRNLLEGACDAGEQYHNEAQNESVLSDFFNYIGRLRDFCEKIVHEIRTASLTGMVDFFILPTKNRFDEKDIPKEGAILGFDLVGSKLLSDEYRNRVLLEARRVAYKYEAWLWSDEGDSLILVIADHVEDPHISYKERALLCAIELTARITYKFTIGTQELVDNEKFYSESNIVNVAQFQRLRVALTSWNESNRMYDGLSRLKSVMDDPKLKYHNTLFLVGEDIIKSLQGNLSAYKINFSQAIKQHSRTNENIFWSVPIGWRTLDLFLEGSICCYRPGFECRSKRYQVPGNIEMEIHQTATN